MSFVIRLAAASDLYSIVKLLKQGKLNVKGIDEHIDDFIVAEHVDKKEIVGTAGMEVFRNRYALLRSLVLSRTAPPRLGMDLLKVLLQMAHQKELPELYLLARSARPFFAVLGFEEVDWDDIPSLMRESTHFQQYDPETSTAMVYRRGVESPVHPLVQGKLYT